MKQYRLCRDSFIRTIEQYGYITSQLTKHDRVYDAIGRMFLISLSRTPQKIDTLLEKVVAHFENPPKEQIRVDLEEFLLDLESDGYIVSGETFEEIEEKEPKFSYAMENPKTTVYNYLQNKDDIKFNDTSDIFCDVFRTKPHIFACQIEVTNQCNERCIHCYIPHEAKNELLPTEIILDTLMQLNQMGTLGLTISGGEAFIHPDIDKILLKARELDFTINILSNLTLIKPDHVTLLKKVNPSLVQTSLYSMNSEEHDHITKCKGSHTKTLTALETLIEADIPVQISCPVMKTNLHSYKAVLQWAQEHRCKAQTDFIMMARSDLTTDNLNERLSIEETKELMADILEVDIEYGALIDTPRKVKPVEQEKEEPVCGVGIDNICLGANGNFYPCSGWQGYAVGDVRKETIVDMWQNSPQLQYLRTVKRKTFPQCLVCEDKYFCAMCLVRNFNESGGDMFNINRHFCEAAHINRLLVEEHKKTLV